MIHASILSKKSVICQKNVRYSIFSCHLLCRSLLQYLQRFAELVGTGCGFCAAADALCDCYYFVDVASLCQTCYADGITWAAAHEFYLLDDVVIICCDVDATGTCARCGVLDFFHNEKMKNEEMKVKG